MFDLIYLFNCSFMDPRHAARILALQTLFEENFQVTKLLDKKADEFNTKKLCEVNEIAKYDKEIYKKILKTVAESKEEIDKIVEEYAPERPLDEISQIDLQILRIAVAEGFIGKFTPVKVSIDEAIELAKEFGGSTSSKFVNGVLGSLLTKTQKE